MSPREWKKENCDCVQETLANMIALIVELRGPPEVKKWHGGTPWATEFCFGHCEILMHMRTVSSSHLLIGEPVEKHVIWYARKHRIEIYVELYLTRFLGWWCHHCHRNASFAPKCPYWNGNHRTVVVGEDFSNQIWEDSRLIQGVHWEECCNNVSHDCINMGSTDPPVRGPP